MRRKLTPFDKCHKTAEWRVVPGFSDYAVSEYGHLRRATATSNGFPAGFLMKPRIQKSSKNTPLIPYVTYTVRLSEKRKTLKAHIAVAAAFIGPRPTPAHHVAHWDGKHHHNHYSNLRYATCLENGEDARRLGRVATGKRNGAYTKPERLRRGVENGNSVLTPKLVRYIRKTGKSLRTLERELGVSRCAITLARNKTTWAHVA